MTKDKKKTEIAKHLYEGYATNLDLPFGQLDFQKKAFWLSMADSLMGKFPELLLFCILEDVLASGSRSLYIESSPTSKEIEMEIEEPAGPGEVKFHIQSSGTDLLTVLSEVLEPLHAYMNSRKD